MRLSPRTTRVGRAVKKMVLETVADHFPEGTESGIYLIGFDWRARVYVLQPLNAESLILDTVQEVLCYRAILHISTSTTSRLKAHVLEIGGDSAYALNVDIENMTVRWCRLDIATVDRVRARVKQW